MICQCCEAPINKEAILVELPCGHAYHYICFHFAFLPHCIGCKAPIRLPNRPDCIFFYDINMQWLESAPARQYLLQQIMQKEETEEKNILVEHGNFRKLNEPEKNSESARIEKGWTTVRET